MLEAARVGEPEGGGAGRGAGGAAESSSSASSSGGAVALALGAALADAAMGGGASGGNGSGNAMASSNGSYFAITASKAMRSAPPSVRMPSRSSFSASKNSPFLLALKCKWGPVERPVDPT
jgi:hypothetical protein